jgi:hypothetical protein
MELEIVPLMNAMREFARKFNTMSDNAYKDFTYKDLNK